MHDEFGPAVSSFDPQEAYRKPRRRRNAPAKAEGAQKTTKSAFSRVVQLCAVRDRSRRELEERLVRDGYPLHEAQDALRRATDCNLVDDMRFADAFIRARVSAGKGLRAIEFDLSKHGIDPQSIKGWPESYGLDEESQFEQALRFIESHPPRCKDVMGGAYRKLVSKGYNSSIASSVARRWADECRKEY